MLCFCDFVQVHVKPLKPYTKLFFHLWKIMKDCVSNCSQVYFTNEFACVVCSVSINVQQLWPVWISFLNKYKISLMNCTAWWIIQPKWICDFFNENIDEVICFLSKKLIYDCQRNRQQKKIIKPVATWNPVPLFQ